MCDRDRDRDRTPGDPPAPQWRVEARARATRRRKLGLARETVAARLGIPVRQLALMETTAWRVGDTLARAWDAALWKEVP